MYGLVGSVLYLILNFTMSINHLLIIAQQPVFDCRTVATVPCIDAVLRKHLGYVHQKYHLVSI